MPALTHGRVKNGFNLLPRTIRYAQGKCDNDAASANQNMEEPTKWQNEAPLCKGSQRALCCGRPLQYTSMMGANLFRNSRIPTGPANRKFASTVSVGRSFAAKRAIARRTANCHPEHGTGGWSGTFQITSLKAPLPPVAEMYELLGRHPGLFLNKSISDMWMPGSILGIVDSYNITDVRHVIYGGDGNTLSRPVYYIKANFKKFYILPTGVSSPGTAPLKMLEGSPPTGMGAWWMLPQTSFTITGMVLSIEATPDAGEPFGSTELSLSYNFKQRLSGGTKCCCLMPTVTYSQPVNAYRNPCSGGLAKKRLLIPCTNPTSSFDNFKKK